MCAPLSGHASAEHATTCDTNLHTHGFHVSPSDNSDNPFLRVAAGESFQYEFQLPPDHPSGIYHYHPHLHGASHKQVFGGMVGAIIIEGDLDRLPGIDGVPERLLILQATQLTPDGGSVIDQGAATQREYLRLVNGQLNPTMTIQPGETQRWRVQNLTASTTFRLRLDGHQLHQIAKDGNTLNETWTRDDDRPLARGAGRGAGPGRPGRDLRAADAPLLHRASRPRSQRPWRRSSRRAPRSRRSRCRRRCCRSRTSRPREIDERRRITFQIKPPIDPPIGQRGPAAQIDSHFFDADRDDQVVRLNTTEEWVIRNASTQWHPFHIHINDYQVVAVNGAAGAACATDEDTTPVPPFGEITIRTRFRDFPGSVGLPLPHPAARGPRHDGHDQGPRLSRMATHPQAGAGQRPGGRVTKPAFATMPPPR